MKSDNNQADEIAKLLEEHIGSDTDQSCEVVDEVEQKVYHSDSCDVQHQNRRTKHCRTSS